METNSIKLLSDDYEISKEFLSFIDTMDENAAILDEKGKIIYINKAWIEFARANDMAWDNYGLGEDYLKIARNAEGEGAETARKAAEGIEAVLAGEMDNFFLEYPCHLAEEIRWFKLKVQTFAENKAAVMHEDIAERKKTEKELKNNKEKLNNILNNTDDVIWSLSWPDLSVEFINSAAEDIYGYSPEEFREDPELWKKATHPEDRHLDEKVLKEVQEKGRAVKENRVITKDGNIKWVQDKAKMIYNENDKPVRVEGISRDITERKKSERELSKEKERFESLFENNTSATAMLDDEGKIVDINEEFKNCFGYQLSEIKGEHLDDVLEWGKEGYADREATNEFLRGNKKRGEGTRYDKEGNPGEYLFHGVPIVTENEIEGAYTIYDDITELKRNREELQKTKNYLEAILASIQDGISVLDPDLTIRYANDTMKRLYSENAPLEGKKCHQVYRNKNEPCEECPTLRALESGEVEKEIVPGLEDSESQHLELFSYPMIEEDTGEVTGIVEFVRDITERKKREEDLKLTQFSVDKAPVGVFWVTPEGEFEYANDRACEILSYSKDELVGMKVADIDPNFQTENHDKEWQRINEKKHDKLETQLIRKAGKKFPAEVISRYLQYKDKKYELAFVQDITARKKRKEQLKYMSFHDDLTDLYNRTFMEKEMERLDTERQHPISLIYCDVNGLKIVNDTYGHDVGDKYLIKVSEILRNITRSEDLVARWAGDEFVILLPQTDREMAEEIIERIESASEEAEFKDIPITLGIGLAANKKEEISFETVFNRADERMYKDKLTKSRSAENKLVQNMLATLEAKSAETREHSMRMTELAHELGNEADLNSEQVNDLTLVATLHDIGKVTISEDILTRNGDLTEEEWQIIKEHPEMGYKIASATEEFSPIAPAILYHHEHWNGSGYPVGLEGDEIPLLSRIISIVDAYDVMTAGRPYKEAMSNDEALEEINKCAGTQFDPELAEMFVEIIQTSPSQAKL
ncbi:PAS domain S-box protein [Halarsenatibacter silvermanii]|uniref:PAS domain S-box-containing protein/diguanylate cyclase (GGDEF) domain-containing protein n=1 Tax=Halarsenatibacter silvermanii TaxID=321763 RepID=A0A1G9PT32_9FIRM|nr:PAS domain S-box protein [Halarsenatibacter silvermanii]SDM01651.1 PAS domain S-box-containing protein/diguanylate cyclase (GGDEF) domain-containing protein [Halarsenatibacter silvermanii]